MIPFSVDAQPLPEATNSDYLGAVGDFTISREISTTGATVGESIEITTRFNGTGNVPLISKPKYQLPDGLEIYEPQENSNINRANQKISGNKSFTDVIIARSPGNYTIPKKRFRILIPIGGIYHENTAGAQLQNQQKSQYGNGPQYSQLYAGKSCDGTGQLDIAHTCRFLDQLVAMGRHPAAAHRVRRGLLAEILCGKNEYRQGFCAIPKSGR
ncbi:MAG: BatD family protein [Fodinibius sp.]|nr:BatD family protein [Fodinibius sp.]